MIRALAESGGVNGVGTKVGSAGGVLSDVELGVEVGSSMVPNSSTTAGVLLTEGGSAVDVATAVSVATVIDVATGVLVAIVIIEVDIPPKGVDVAVLVEDKIGSKEGVVVAVNVPPLGLDEAEFGRVVVK